MYDAGEGRGGGGWREQPGPEAGQARQQALHDVSQVEILFTHICRLCWNFFKQSIGARNRAGIGLSDRPARLHSLAELVPWKRFLGSL